MSVSRRSDRHTTHSLLLSLFSSSEGCGTCAPRSLAPEARGWGSPPRGLRGTQGSPQGQRRVTKEQGAPHPPPRSRGLGAPVPHNLRGAVPPPPGSVGRQAPLTGVAPQAEPLL